MKITGTSFAGSLTRPLLIACALARLTLGAEVSEELKILREQNQRLQQELDRQKQQIEQLQKTVGDLGRIEKPSPEPPPTAANAGGLLTKPFSGGNLLLSGEAGLAFIDQGPRGGFKNSEFRVDEAKLFLEAKLLEDVYVFTEINVLERESDTQYLGIGELYVDFESLAKKWGDHWLNLRVGRFNTPFGEEYLSRHAIDNPLVTHSLSDVWGVDEGIEAYGTIEMWRYALAVQNGGNDTLRDYNADKAVIARLGYQPARWLDLSASGMRTGDLDIKNEKFSALWFGNGFFRTIGYGPGITKFSADLAEGDAKVSFSRGYLKGAGGYARATDNGGPRDSRDIYYYYTEGLFDVTPEFYTAGRVSQIFAKKGYPLVGGGNFGERMFGALTEDLWRFSLGLGYRFSKDLVVKAEYSLNGGHELGGVSRSQENLFGVELALRF